MSRYEGFLAETRSYSGFGGDVVESYFAQPLGVGPYPGVVVAHHNPGWDDATKELTRRFAFEGFCAIAPNLFFREGGESSSDDSAAAARAQGWPSDAQVSGDLGGALAFLRTLPSSSGRVGIIGFCSGGRHAYLAACQLDFDAAVDAHGGGVVPRSKYYATSGAGLPNEITDKRPVVPIDLTEQMNAPLLGLFGEDDPSPSPANMAEIEAALRRFGKEYEFHSYPGAGHGFMDTSRPAYRVEAANDAWEKILAFYAKHL